MHESRKWQRMNLIAFSLIVICKLENVQGDAAIVTSVNYAFETFSPYALIRFFEFSDREWNITQKCFRDMYVYVQGLRNGEYWAVKLYDASSYYAGAAFAGSTVRLHNPNLCRFLSHQFREGSKVLIAAGRESFILPFDVQLITGQFLMEIGYDNFFRFEKLQQMICFPKSCTNTDLEEILEVYLFQTTTFVRNVTYLRHRIVGDNYKLYEDFDFYVIVIIILGSLLVHTTVHLLRNYITTSNRLKAEPKDTQSNVSKDSSKLSTMISFRGWQNSLDSVDLKQFTLTKKEEQKEDKTVTPPMMPPIVSRQTSYYYEELLDAASLPNVLYQWFQTTSTPLCGLMFIFSLAFIAMHLVTEYSFMANNLDLGMINSKVKLRDVLLKRSVYIMDMYFLISGANLSYDFFRSLPKKTFDVRKQMKHVLKLIVYKIVGLTPSYTFALYVALLLDKYLHANVALEIPSRDYTNCSHNIIFNVLYLDTFFPLIDRCMPWTWFIALKIHFYMASCLLMLLVELQVSYALVMGISLMAIASVAATMWSLSISHQYGYSTTLLYDFMHFNLVSDNICLFVLPYLLGVALGHIIHKANNNITFSLPAFTTGWILAIILMTLDLFAMQFFMLHLNKWMRALMNVASHLLWGCIVFWLVLTALSNYGDFFHKALSFKFANCLQRLTPINILIAPIIIRLILFTGDIPIYWSKGLLLSMYIGCLLATYVGSAFLYILLDGPLMMALECLMDIKF